MSEDTFKYAIGDKFYFHYNDRVYVIVKQLKSPDGDRYYHLGCNSEREKTLVPESSLSADWFSKIEREQRKESMQDGDLMNRSFS